MSTEEQNIMDELDAQFGEDMANIPERPSDMLTRQKATFRIESAYLNKSQTSNRKQLTIATVIIESNNEESVGKKYKKNWGLETEENIQWLKKDMRALELDPPTNAKSLAALTQLLTGICFVGSLVPNVDEAFPPNCFINAGARKHDMEGAATNTGGGAPSSDI